MGTVFIKPLFGKFEPVGRAFVSYAHEDSTMVKNNILHPFKERGIPYFVDDQLLGGSDTLESLYDAMDFAACAVVAVSDRTLASPWVWFETGVLFGRGKKIIPFILEPSRQKEIMDKLPDFALKVQIVSDVERLLDSVTDSILDVAGLFDDLELTRRVTPKLKRVELCLELNLEPALAGLLTFGYLLIRFGRSAPEPGAEWEDERKLILKAMNADEVRNAEAGEATRIEYVIPTHDKLGTTFKCFVDVPDVKLASTAVHVLENEGMLDVRQSDAAEKQRVYFLLPLSDRCIVEEGGAPNNYIYPV